MRWLSAAVITTALSILPTAADAQTLESVPFAKKLKLAKVGDEEAQMAVARAYETGQDVEPDAAEAAKWYRKAAEQGNLDAQFRLGRLVQDGVPGLKKNPETAAKLYEGAAKQGHVEAQNWLGYCYQHGIGVAQSDGNAVLWYTRAADAGLAAAQNNLGLVYLNAKGKERNLNKAFEQFDKAAQQGDGWGLNNLGGMYEMGWGVAQDKDKALEYYAQAVAKGNERAKDNLERLQTLLGKSAAKSAPTESGSSVPPQAPAAETSEPAAPPDTSVD